MSTDNVVRFPGSDPTVSDALVAAVEAALFASGAPIAMPALREACAGASDAEILLALDRIARATAGPDRGIEVAEVGGGWQLRTKLAVASVAGKVAGRRPQRLSRPALEVLAVVAWRQPVTRHEVDDVRGVDCGAVLRTLVERGLVRVAGRRDEPGRPLEYATTPAFLEMFSLPSLGALPTLREREEMSRGPEELG